MNITILTPDKEIFHGKIVSVKVPGTLGQFQVLKNHAPIVSSLEAGEVSLVTDGGSYRYYDEESGTIKNDSLSGKKISFIIGGGFIEVLNNEVSLLVRAKK
ncbi:MAG: F0F1 ATP synthase subunit epsilon [Lewinellaceae bacterium]|nr:F0F1 ATP synthase subunit epsilon [Saprospiraceae bacterium]MCB9338048.1 F0F1 ATP synthase subunit epsilon [Lewinellaceae bacterium]